MKYAMEQFPVSFKINDEKSLFIQDEITQNGITATVIQRGEGYIYRTLSLTNNADIKSGQITEPYTVDYTDSCGEALLLHTLRGDDCSKNSFLPVNRQIEDNDTVVMTPDGGRSSNSTAFPFFDLTYRGKTILFAVGWSGQWKCVIERKNSEFNIKIGLENADFYLNPKERVILPSVCIVEGSDADELRRRFRSIILNDFNPIQNRGGKSAHLPISIQPYDRYFYGRCPEWPTVKGQLRTIEGAVKCGGIDTLWIDAAWFRDGFPNGVGNYTFAEGFPDGLKPVSDAAHSAGLNFMVWFEPERIARGSELYAEHPEFLLSVKGDDFTFLFNLGDEAAWKWLFEKLCQMIGDNGIDNFRQDFNMNPLQYWKEHDADSRLGITEIKYIEGFYKLWDGIRLRFPKLIIDDCSSGGRRIDFETIKRAVPMWRSDITCGPITESAHNDVYNQNQTLCLSEYLPYHACAAWEPIVSEIRSAETSGLACTFDILNSSFNFDKAKAILTETNRLAGYWDGDFYKLTEPTLEENVFCAYQIAKPDRGMAAFFRRAECECDTFKFLPNQIKGDVEYKITLTDESLAQTSYTLPGADFIGGIDVIIPSKHQSLILEYIINYKSQ
jgi:Alpha-galactosidase